MNFQDPAVQKWDMHLNRSILIFCMEQNNNSDQTVYLFMHDRRTCTIFMYAYNMIEEHAHNHK